MLRVLLIFFLIVSCAPTGTLKTNKNNIYLSNDKVLYDLEKKSWKVEFSINNYTNKPISNFSYILNFKDKNEVPISTIETKFNGEIGSKRASRAFTLIDDFTRKNYNSFDIEIK